MARLYVVNATGQNRIVNFRTEFTVDDEGRRTTERNRPYKNVQIPARTQVPFGGEMPIAHVHQIIKQLEATCGAVPDVDIQRAKAKGLVKLVYKVDAPVPRAILKDVVLHNLALLTEQGEDRRKRLALGATLQLQGVQDPLGSIDGVRNVEVEFESVGDTEDSDLTTPALAQGFKVADRADTKAARSRGRGRAK